MFSGQKLLDALKATIDDLNQTKNDDDIEKIEHENNQLRQKKMELTFNLNHPSAVSNNLILLKDMITRQKNLNQSLLEFKLNAVERLKDRSVEANTETFLLKQKLNEADNLMTLPYHDVLNKVMEFEEKNSENRSVIAELKVQHSQLVQNVQNESEESEDIRFIETLKCIAEERRNLIEMLKQSSHIDETNE